MFLPLPLTLIEGLSPGDNLSLGSIQGLLSICELPAGVRKLRRTVFIGLLAIGKHFGAGIELCLPICQLRLRVAELRLSVVELSLGVIELGF